MSATKAIASWVKRPVGAHTTEEIDRRFGRWWFGHQDKRRPIRYTDVGELSRRPGLHLSLLYKFQRHTKNWCKYTKSHHRKRWPSHYNLNADFFSEFCNHVPWRQKNLFETCATLPGYGVGYKFWRPKFSRGHKAGEYTFVLEDIDYEIRPSRGNMRGITYLNNKPLIRNMAPAGKNLGGWAFSKPDDTTSDIVLYRPKFPAQADPDAKPIWEVILQAEELEGKKDNDDSGGTLTETEDTDASSGDNATSEPDKLVDSDTSSKEKSTKE